MKKLCLILVLAASMAAAHPRGAFLEHIRIRGPWTHAPEERVVHVWGWLPIHWFFMRW
jgi:hypothetical protein